MTDGMRWVSGSWLSPPPMGQPGRIEIPQRHPTQPVRLSVPVEDPLDKQLGFAVGIDRLLGMIVRNGQDPRNPECRTTR